MIRPIRHLGDPVLKAPAREVDPAELGGDDLHALLRDMAETLADSGGVGLAAPQVGESLRVILAGSFPSARGPDRPFIPTQTLVNPRVVQAGKAVEPGWEGCLSIPGLLVRVARHTEIAVEYLTPDGTPSQLEAAGFFARVIQHEIDHLDGILTLDRVSSPEDVMRVAAPNESSCPPGHPNP